MMQEYAEARPYIMARARYGANFTCARASRAEKPSGVAVGRNSTVTRIFRAMAADTGLQESELPASSASEEGAYARESQ